MAGARSSPRFKLFPRILWMALALSFSSENSSLLAQDCSRCHVEAPQRSLLKSFGFSEKAVGVLDKGKLQNNTSNVGDLSNFHFFFTNSGHWPREADEDRQYLYGLGLVIAVREDNVIETVTQAMTKVTDWLPPDDAAGRHYSGEIRAASDETPFQASSDFRETWPYGYYAENGIWTDSEDRVWPGYFRIDVNHPDFPQVLAERENEFTSDRDAFCIYNDDYNAKGRVGIEVEQTGYSYGRPYAEDFVLWDLNIYNTSGNDLDDIYLGFYTKIRPDFDMHDYLNFVDTDGDGRRDLVYVYDLNNVRNKTWAYTEYPMAVVGFRIFDTPFDLGITDFHHFARGVSPTTDEEMWALMTSDRESSHLVDADYYFHGSDTRIDDTSEEALGSYYPSWLDEESGVELEGDGINFIVSSGPFTLKADSMVTTSVGLIMGSSGDIPDEPDTTDLMRNVEMANLMHESYFQGSGPPEAPEVEAVAADGRATIYWSAEPSESSVDVLTGKRDFEGYKIFRSTDQGSSWGDVVTDANGIPVGFVPIATFDLEDDVSGLDPAFPQYLGVNSGLAHTYVDSNLINGVEYWYCVTAYDRGNQDPDSLEQSYMYPIGSSVFERHVVSVLPGPKAANITNASVSANRLEAEGGKCDGIVRIELLDPGTVSGHGYKIIFGDTITYATTQGDTVRDISFSLIDTTINDTLLLNHPLSDESGDNMPALDGLRITVQNSPTGISFIGWTEVAGDTSTFDWRIKSRRPDLVPGNQAYGTVIETFDDFRITVDTTESGGLDAAWYDIFSGEWAHNLDIDPPLDSTVHLPLRVELITDPADPVDISEHTILAEFTLEAPWEEYRSYYYSAPGWDLVPGGAGFTAGSPGWYELHVDMLILQADEEGDNYLYLLTNNTPDSYTNSDGEIVNQIARPPSHGDQFTIKTYKPFREGIYYTFGTTPLAEVTDTDVNALENLQVVPDPYIATNIWETTEFGKKLQFNHLPNACTIMIYTLLGEHVATVNHDSPAGYEFWDMRSKNDQFIAPGVYLFHASTPDGDEMTGRFLVIK